VAALQILRILKARQVPLSKLARCWTRFPQLVTNVVVREKRPFDQLEGLNRLIAGAQKDLSAQGGRLLLRYSGTEPKARLLVEGRDHKVLAAWSKRICSAIEKQIGIRAPV
jgi:phosphoglucosamine mutase